MLVGLKGLFCGLGVAVKKTFGVHRAFIFGLEAVDGDFLAVLAGDG